MIRFVDLRGADIGYRFAWFNTISDTFERHGGYQVWDTFAEFMQDYHGTEIKRYEGLCPDWAFEEPKDE